MNRMTPTIGLILATLASNGCSLTGDAPPVQVAPANSAICTALAPSYPLREVSIDSKRDTPATVALAKKHNLEYREANARYAAACK